MRPHFGIGAVDLGRAGDRPEAQAAPLLDGDPAAVVGDQRRGGVDDRLHHLVEVECRGDLAADGEQRV
jgi:hypothetical protein